MIKILVSVANMAKKSMDEDIKDLGKAIDLLLEVI